MLTVEEEIFTTCVASNDSTYLRDKRRHLVPVDMKAGTIDFTREDRVVVEFNVTTRGWSPIGILDLDLTRDGFIAVDASLYRARDGALLCRVGSELRFKSMMETDSRTRRTTATKRILGRRSVLPNLIDYFSGKAAEPRLMPVTVSRDNLAQQYDLNPSQSEAFVSLLAMRPLGLLQGPPGTGKTKFIASLVHYLLSNGLIKNVLASQSHEAVNNATESILQLFRRGTLSRVSYVWGKRAKFGIASPVSFGKDRGSLSRKVQSWPETKIPSCFTPVGAYRIIFRRSVFP